MKPDITKVLEHYGFENLTDYGGWKATRCVFHGDRHASASYNPEEQVFRCHVCDIGGDAYAIVMAREGVDFVEAKRRVQAITGDDGSSLSVGSRSGSSKLSARQRAKSGGNRALSAGRGKRAVR